MSEQDNAPTHMETYRLKKLAMEYLEKVHQLALSMRTDNWNGCRDMIVSTCEQANEEVS